MDLHMHEYLAEQHIRDLLAEAEAQRGRRIPSLDMATQLKARQTQVTCVALRLRRQLGILLIQAGQRLAGGPSPISHRTSTTVGGRRLAS
jgi:hypothetical protein